MTLLQHLHNISVVTVREVFARMRIGSLRLNNQKEECWQAISSLSIDLQLSISHILYVRACVMRLESIWIRGGIREEEREHQTRCLLAVDEACVHRL
jgi:hypothetical protein